MHVIFDPRADYPSILDITDANVNDAQIGRTITIEPGATYVFDKGYCHYSWWTMIADKGAVFITRPKTNMRLGRVGEHPPRAQGDGVTVLEDSEELPIRLHRLLVQRTDSKTITLLTNDLERPAVDISTRPDGRSSCCFAGSNSISTSAASSATTTTRSASRSLPR